MNKLTQQAKILEYLKEGHTLTVLEAIPIIGSTKADTRISELRAKGVEIQGVWEENNGKRYMRYSMRRDTNG